MTWLYLPPDALTQPTAGEACADSRSARASVASTSASTSPSPAIELFVTSSGTPMPRPLSWRGWKTRPWIKRLSGTTLKPSTAKHGVAQWISSMAAIRASLSALPEENSETKTRAISGLTSLASSMKSDRQSVSSKMSADIYDWGSNKSTMTFDGWVTALRLACLQRKKSVLPTNAKDCSSGLPRQRRILLVHARATTGKDDPQGRTQRPAHAVTGRDSDAAGGISLTRNRIWQRRKAADAIQSGEDPMANTTAHANRAAQARITASA